MTFASSTSGQTLRLTSSYGIASNIRLDASSLTQPLTLRANAGMNFFSISSSVANLSAVNIVFSGGWASASNAGYVEPPLCGTGRERSMRGT